MSVLRYPGGKTRAIKHILPYIPDDTTVLYSPFFGGGSIELTCTREKPQLTTVNANDKFSPLMNFWVVAKYHRERLIQELNTLRSEMSKDMFHTVRNSLKNEENHVKKAAMYFAINRCSFSGATFSGGYSDESRRLRFTESSIKRISQLDLSKVNFECLDFHDFFNRHAIDLMKPGHCIYADPPYLLEGKSNNLYGDNGDLHENFPHQTFKESIVKFPCWIISYNDCETIREMYKDYDIIELTWAYGMGIPKKSVKSDEKRATKKDGKEILIVSRAISDKDDVKKMMLEDDVNTIERF